MNGNLMIVSGGETGAERAALECAKEFRVRTYGWARRRWLTELGPDPALFALGLVAFKSEDEHSVQRMNVGVSDAVLWFGRRDTEKYGVIIGLCESRDIPFLDVHPDATTPKLVKDWIAYYNVGAICVSSCPESQDPGVQSQAKAFLSKLFILLGKTNVTEATRTADVPDLPSVRPARPGARQGSLPF